MQHQNALRPPFTPRLIIGVLAVLGVSIITLLIVMNRSQPVTPAAQFGGGLTRNSVAAERLLEVVQSVVPSATRSGNITVSANVQAVDSKDGIITLIHVPLEGNTAGPALNDTVAKLANTVFQSEPEIARLGIITTVPGTNGREMPTLTVIIARSEWERSGPLTGLQLRQRAQSYQEASKQ